VIQNKTTACIQIDAELVAHLNKTKAESGISIRYQVEQAIRLYLIAQAKQTKKN
jgi:hypothetical protein